MDSRKTGELIKEIRIEKNMKQKDLADRLFVSVAAVSKWENGHGFPDVSVLPDLCRILDLSIEEFMKGERNPMENKQNTEAEEESHQNSEYFTAAVDSCEYNARRFILYARQEDLCSFKGRL